MKQKRYWLRFGIVFSILGALSVIAYYTYNTWCNTSCNIPEFFEYIIFYPSLPATFAVLLIGQPIMYLVKYFDIDMYHLFGIDTDHILLSVYFAVVLQVIIYFTIGSIIGWIYGKIKNRNKI